MRGVQLRVRGTVPCSHRLGRPVDQIAIVIAAHMHRLERHQPVHGAPRFERAAGHVAEVDDIVDALRADVGQHGIEREMVAMDIGDRGEAHGVLIGRHCVERSHSPSRGDALF